MSREYVGTGLKDPERLAVHVEQDGTHQTLTHRVRGEYVDYTWDGGGPNSNELAQALLWLTTGVEPAWRTYRLFKNEVVAAWPKCVGECWRLSEDEIRQWLAGVEHDTAQMETTSQTQARLTQSEVRDTKLRGFSNMFERVAARTK